MRRASRSARRSRRRLRRGLGAPFLLSLALALALVACSGDSPADDPEDEPAAELRSGPEDEFAIVEHAGERYVAGRQVTIAIPPGWEEYEPEQQAPDDTTVEWAVGEPVGAEPVPAGLQFSMAAPGEEGETDTDPLETAMAIAELAPKYRLIDSGEVDVEGAAEARFMRFERQIQYQGTGVLVDQLSLFVRTGPRRWSTIRFIAPVDQWEALMQEPYNSVVVTTDDQ